MRGAGARRDLVELLDRPDIGGRELAGNLRDLRLMNRVFGWSAAVWRDVDHLMRRSGLRTATLLDLATGSADIPRDLVLRARRRGVNLNAVVADISAAVLVEARNLTATGPRMDLVQHDAARLPFRDGAVDIVICCLAAHHLDQAALTAALAEMRRVARRAVIVSDLTRGRWAYAGARLLALVLRNRLTSHDGPVSVLRAYTPAELAAVAADAGLRRVQVRRVFPARMTLVAELEDRR